MEDLARSELVACGASELRPTSAGLAFRGDLEVAYRACLWSRLASRVLLRLATVAAASSQQLYAAVRELPWEDHLDPARTLAVDAHVRGDRTVNSHFVALRTKDAIVDRLRDRTGRRPSIDLAHPALRVHVVLDIGRREGAAAQVSIDLSGEPLHRRGYRVASGPAPLKENVAAAMLLRAGWPEVAAAGGALVDPMCGGGTILVEGAWIAAGVAPGLLREAFGFEGWLQHRPELWRRLRSEAERRRRAGATPAPLVAGSDADAAAVARAAEHLRRAGVAAADLAVRDVGAAAPPPGAVKGLVATNPPYGERLGDDELPALYRRLGEVAKSRFAGWQLALLTTDAQLAGEVRMRPLRRNALWNGGLRCELLQYRVRPAPLTPPEAATAGA